MKNKITILISSLFLTLVLTKCKEKDSDDKAPLEIRSPAYAGAFYPASKKTLNTMLDKYFREIKITLADTPKGLIVPHAGYVYSGETAAYAYKTLIPYEKKIKRVILLATNHHSYSRGVVINELTYETPFGRYESDSVAIEKLKKESFNYVEDDIATTREHSDEVQIPFLQKVLPNAKLVPIIVGKLNKGDLEKTARALSKIVDSETIIIASSDFTHYGPRFGYTPSFDKPVPEGIRELDHKAITLMEDGKLKELEAYVNRTGITICGIDPIRLMLKTFDVMNQPVKGKLLKYQTSGALTGDWANSVSYAAIAFTSDEKLSAGEEQKLLRLSRFVLNKYIKKDINSFPEEKIIKKFKITKKLTRQQGVFVTLKKHKELRGCIGYIFGETPIYQGVIHNTINASSSDPRFSKVLPQELKDISIEVSVLTPLKKISSLDEIVVGRDGLYLVKGEGMNSGLLLPQVPVEWKWDKKTYLEQLSFKAGLHRQAYKDKDTVIYRFSAQVFGENEI